jgi:hypothetical protein
MGLILPIITLFIELKKLMNGYEVFVNGPENEDFRVTSSKVINSAGLGLRYCSDESRY